METKGRTIGSILREMNANRNTDLRRKVVNVGRPDTAPDPTSDKSKLAKQAEIKTKIIDEDYKAELPSIVKSIKAKKSAADMRREHGSHYKKLANATSDEHGAKYTRQHLLATAQKHMGEEVELGEEKDDTPFEGPYEKKGEAKDKNVARNIARKAMKKMRDSAGKQVKEESEELDEKYAKGYKSPWDKIEKAKPGIGARIDAAAAAVKQSADDYQKVVDKDKKKEVKEAADALAGDVTTNGKDTEGATTKDKKKKPDTDEMEPGTIKGGKTEVDLKPKTNDQPEDATKEDEKSKSTRKAENAKIGAKGVKEEAMTNKNFGLPEALIQSVTEVLKGKQHKIDANHNGKIDAHDFKLLRSKKGMKEEVEQIDEISQKKATSAYAHASDPDYEHPKADKIRGHIERKFGKTAGKHADTHAYTSHFGRSEPGKTPSDYFKHKDKLTGFDKTKPGRVTKSGTMNKSDQKYNAGQIKKRLGTHTKPKLPESVELSANEVARIEEILKGQE